MEYENYLLHAKGKPKLDHKYIKREWKKGKWQYTYPDEKTDKKEPEKTVEKTKPKLSETISKGKQLVTSKYTMVNKMDDVDGKPVESTSTKLKPKNAASDEELSVFTKKASPTTNDEDMAVINPNFYDSELKYQYDENCAVCTLTYDMRRRGYDVVAGPEGMGAWAAYGDMGISLNEMIDWYVTETGAPAGMNLKGSASYKVNNPEVQDMNGLLKLAEEDMAAYGEGARGFLSVTWDTFGSHAIAWEVENGKVVVRDCQNNRKSDLSYYADCITNFSFLRTDNLEISKSALKFFHNREEGDKS